MFLKKSVCEQEPTQECKLNESCNLFPFMDNCWWDFSVFFPDKRGEGDEFISKSVEIRDEKEGMES